MYQALKKEVFNDEANANIVENSVQKEIIQEEQKEEIPVVETKPVKTKSIGSGLYFRKFKLRPRFALLLRPQGITGFHRRSRSPACR